MKKMQRIQKEPKISGLTLQNRSKQSILRHAWCSDLVWFSVAQFYSPTKLYCPHLLFLDKGCGKKNSQSEHEASGLLSGAIDFLQTECLNLNWVDKSGMCVAFCILGDGPQRLLVLLQFPSQNSHAYPFQFSFISTLISHFKTFLLAPKVLIAQRCPEISIPSHT